MASSMALILLVVAICGVFIFLGTRVGDWFLNDKEIK